MNLYKYFIGLACSAIFVSHPVSAAEELCNLRGNQWKPAKIPSELKKELPGGKVTILKAVINIRGELGYLIRADSGGGQHAAPAKIFVKTESGWKPVYDGDVSIASIPTVILPKATHGFYELCDPFPCCGESPVVFKFDGTHYR